MKNTKSKKIPNPLQKIILAQVANRRDEDGWCRLLNAELAHFSSDIKIYRFRKELKALVDAGYLLREVGPQEGRWTERKLRVTPKVQELML